MGRLVEALSSSVIGVQPLRRPSPAKTSSLHAARSKVLVSLTAKARNMKT